MGEYFVTWLLFGAGMISQYRRGLNEMYVRKLKQVLTSNSSLRVMLSVHVRIINKHQMCTI